MDSLSNLAVSALAQIRRVISTAELLQVAHPPLTTLVVECGQICGGLLQIQNLISMNENNSARFAYSGAVTQHATVLRACSSVFISINEQLATLNTNETKSKRSSILGRKLRSLLNPSKDAQVEAMCHSIRDQTAAINHLVHTLQEESTGPAVELLPKKKATNDRASTSKLAGCVGNTQLGFSSDQTNLQIMSSLHYCSDQQAFLIDQKRAHPELALVEVDVRSMTSLVQKLRTLESLQGLHATAPGIRAELESLIEQSNCLYDDSPALLECSTRVSIIQAKTIQYGAKRGSNFQIIATNDLIKGGLISLARYFSHFAIDGPTPFRSRLMHLVILLLSMVSDVDLHELSDFLESAYNLRADRGFLELLFLKFLPLEASTPKAFLQYVSFALLGPQSTDVVDFDSHIGQSHCWDACILQALDRGFLLPAATPDLGRDDFSWISKWPEEGYRSSRIFKNLQSATLGPRTLVDLAFDELQLKRKLWWKIIIMTDAREYGIQAADFDKITSMVPGQYLVQEACSSYAYLVIEKRDINSDIFKAMKNINKVIAELKKTGMIEQLPPACQWSGKLEQIGAVIEKKVVALNFEMNGTDVYRNNAARAMSQDRREATERVDQILRQLAQTKDPFIEIHQALREAAADLMLAKQAREKIVVADDFDLNSNPISKVLTEPSVSPLSARSHWSDYKAWFEGVQTCLHIEALRSVVLDVKWLSSHKAQLSLHGLRLNI